MNVNEKIALLASVDVIMTDGTEHEVNTQIVDYFRSVALEDYEFLVSASASSEEILEAAIAKIQEVAGQNDASGTRLSADPYQSSNNSGNTGGTSLSTGGGADKPVASGDDNKTKSTTDKKDVTAKLAGTLPSTTRTKLGGMVDQRWDDLIAAANNTSVGAYCVDTEVRKFLIDKSFIVTNEDYKKAFLEKYNASNVVDDNEYGAPGADGLRPVTKAGDNMTAYNNIVNKIQSGGSFNVRVPDVQNQKVIGMLFNKQGSDEVVKPMKDVPIYVLTELGGKVPGQPGIEVTGIVASSRTKTKNGTVDIEEKQSIAIKHRGKVDAMRSDEKFIRYTAKPIDEAVAEKEFGAPKKEYSVSSVDSFRYKDKEGKEHVMRVRGKIAVPFFARKEEFQVFGPISAANRVEALSEADKPHLTKLYAAAIRSPYLSHEFAAAAGLGELVADIEKVSGTPAFNAGDVG